MLGLFEWLQMRAMVPPARSARSTGFIAPLAAVGPGGAVALAAAGAAAGLAPGPGRRSCWERLLAGFLG